MIAMKLERVGYIPCCMERGLCVGFRLPPQIASSYRNIIAANGIQRWRYESEADTTKFDSAHRTNRGFVLYRVLVVWAVKLAGILLKV